MLRKLGVWAFLFAMLVIGWKVGDMWQGNP